MANVSLTRITSTGNFIPEIDGLRFIAILSVVSFHIYEYANTKLGTSSFGLLGDMLHNGQRGVPLFFVISGFILGRPFAEHYLRGREAPKPKDYFVRRLTRLEPPYLIALLAVFFGLSFFVGHREVLHLLASMGYAHNLFYGSPNPFYSLTWSLEVEVQFYCLIPLIAGIYKCSRSLRRSVLLMAMFAGVINLLPIPSRIPLSILGWGQCFAAGLLLADLYVDRWNAKQHWGFDLLSVVLWPTVFILSDGLSWLLLPSISLCLYVAAFRSFLFRRLFTFGPIVIIGGMCYSIYLVHYAPISLIGHYLRTPIIFTLVSIAVIGAVSLAFFLLIERPCMKKNWPALLMQRRRAATESVPQSTSEASRY